MIENCIICGDKIIQNKNKTKKYCLKKYCSSKYFLENKLIPFSVKHGISISVIRLYGLNFLEKNPKVIEVLQVAKDISGTSSKYAPIKPEVKLDRRKASRKRYKYDPIKKQASYKRYLEKNKEKIDANKEEFLKTRREKYYKRKTEDVLNCVHCNIELENNKNKNRRYCSKSCQRKAHYKRTGK